MSAHGDQISMDESVNDTSSYHTAAGSKTDSFFSSLAMYQSFDIEETLDAKKIMNNFIVMTACFSANHGCITTVIAFAGADEGAIGTYSTGVMYGSYMLTALFVSNVILAWLGTKWSLVLGLAVYTVYLLAFLLATLYPGPLGDILIITGAAVGGCGSGFMWIAQGTHFVRSANAYAVANNRAPEDVTGLFSSTFAFYFLTFEVGLKLVGSVIKQLGGKDGTIFMYLTFFLIGA
jgi:hypothetical protein